MSMMDRLTLVEQSLQVMHRDMRAVQHAMEALGEAFGQMARLHGVTTSTVDARLSVVEEKLGIAIHSVQGAGKALAGFTDPDAYPDGQVPEEITNQLEKMNAQEVTAGAAVESTGAPTSATAAGNETTSNTGGNK